MEFSDFGKKLCGESGILKLMDDIGKPLPPGIKPYRLGGGNPAQIPEISRMYREEMEKLLNDGNAFESLIGLYDSPQGRVSFIETIAYCRMQRKPKCMFLSFQPSVRNFFFFKRQKNKKNNFPAGSRIHRLCRSGN